MSNTIVEFICISFEEAENMKLSETFRESYKNYEKLRDKSTVCL